MIKMITGIDLMIVGAYVLALFATGTIVGMRESVEDFLVLSRRASVLLVMFSVVSTWLGVGVIAGTAAAAYDTGISFGLTGMAGTLIAILAAAFFAPVIKRFGDAYQAHTLGDFFGIRFSRHTRVAAAVVIVTVYIVFAAVQFTGLASLVTVWSSFSFGAALVAAAALTIIYTAFAGIKSDFYTDAVHFWVIIFVFGAVLTPAMLRSGGGLRALRFLPAKYFDPFAFGGVAYFAGGLIFGVAVVFVSMELWQRVYASSSERTARKALIGAAFAIIPFYAIATLAGLVARRLIPNLQDHNTALFVVMRELLPRGAVGLAVAAFVGVFVSSVNTMIMVVGATLTKDIYLTFINPAASSRRTLWVARGVTLVGGVIGAAASFYVHDIVRLSVIALFLLLVMLPAVVGGFFWKRSTATAATLSIAIGFVVTISLIQRMPTTAFLPAFLASAIGFVAVSLTTGHSASEEIRASEGNRPR